MHQNQPSADVTAAWCQRSREADDLATERARLLAAAVTLEARFADLLERGRTTLAPLCARLRAEAVACQATTVGEGQAGDGEYSDLLTLALGCTEWVAAYDQAATDTLAAGMRYVSTVAALLNITDAEVEARAMVRIAERAAQLTLAASTVPVV